MRGPLAAAGLRLAVAASIAVAALGTVAPFAGTAGQSGFDFGTHEFSALARRAPVQAALDVALLIALIAFALVLVNRALAAATAAAPQRA